MERVAALELYGGVKKIRQAAQLFKKTLNYHERGAIIGDLAQLSKIRLNNSETGAII
jgi:hypothetical protein